MRSSSWATRLGGGAAGGGAAGGAAGSDAATMTMVRASSREQEARSHTCAAPAAHTAAASRPSSCSSDATCGATPTLRSNSHNAPAPPPPAPPPTATSAGDSVTDASDSSSAADARSSAADGAAVAAVAAAAVTPPTGEAAAAAEPATGASAAAATVGTRTLSWVRPLLSTPHSSTCSSSPCALSPKSLARGSAKYESVSGTCRGGGSGRPLRTRPGRGRAWASPCSGSRAPWPLPSRGRRRSPPHAWLGVRGQGWSLRHALVEHFEGVTAVHPSAVSRVRVATDRRGAVRARALLVEGSSIVAYGVEPLLAAAEGVGRHASLLRLYTQQPARHALPLLAALAALAARLRRRPPGLRHEQAAEVGVILDHAPRHHLVRLLGTRQLGEQRARAGGCGGGVGVEVVVGGGVIIDDTGARVPPPRHLAGLVYL
eukprot:scaffold70111_cov45-Phaeocystis_antarctica.AAC.1